MEPVPFKNGYELQCYAVTGAYPPEIRKAGGKQPSSPPALRY